MESFWLTLPLIAHTLIGLYFAFFGFWNIYHWRPSMEIMIQRNIPHPWLFLSMGIAWQIAGGFMIIMNFYIKIAAVALIPFTLIAIFIYYPFWKFKGEHRVLYFTLFVANLTMTVGALILLLNQISSITQVSDLLT